MSRENRFGVNVVLADLAKRRKEGRGETDSDDSENSNADDSDVDETYLPQDSTNSSSDQPSEEEEDDHSDQNALASASKRSRHRCPKPETWKRNIQKAAKPKKSPQAIDCSKCRLKCTSKISEAQREFISSNYHGLEVVYINNFYMD